MNNVGQKKTRKGDKGKRSWSIWSTASNGFEPVNPHPRFEQLWILSSLNLSVLRHTKEMKAIEGELIRWIELALGEI
jgi:hypothetical protein